ncbi:MAG: isoaspartyl peptidase/L-asparaginase [Sandaracinaceae bacterium]|nr:isoaspartyl peptidase/L-asparaginase [Sandaracinaceae bacterium]
MPARLLCLTLGAALVACGAAPPPRSRAARPAYTLVVHGGAGTAPDAGDPRRLAYAAALREALEEGCAALDGGAASVDVVERIVRRLEDDPLFNAGRGAVMTRDGHHELDASIMRGSDHACGAVAAVRTVRNPIALARAVMDHSPHVLLVGEGAEAFARERGLPEVDNAFFTTDARREAWRGARPDDSPRGTVGAVALDRDGHLAAATSTGGLAGKRAGRVGDSPIVGAGTYADDATCAVSCTGTGEEFIRHGVARAISARMELAGEGVADAARHLVHRTLRPGDGGVIAVSRDGEVAMERSTPAMIRGVCRPGAPPEVFIDDAPEPR